MANVHKLRRSMLSSDLAAALSLPHRGAVADVSAVASAEGAAGGCLCFGVSVAQAGSDAIWITDAPEPGLRTAIASRRPRLDFIRALHHLRLNGCWPAPRQGLIAPSAAIHPSAMVHEGAEIGADCNIGPGAVLHASVRLGDRVAVGAGTVLGHDGFGYERQDDGRLLHFPHLGALIIEDDVTVGNLCSVSRGTLDDTRIGRHTKIDDQVYIAHNVVIGENVLVMSGVRLNGRVRVDANCWLGTGALVREGRTVGQGATIGMGSVAIAPVVVGQVVAGNPARILR